MAAFKRKCANTKVKINNWDHLPPHCHVALGGKNVLVGLATLAVLRPGGVTLPAQLRRCLKDWQLEMLVAWESVQPMDDNGS